MPIHDWTLVSPGTWHSFHLSWTGELLKALNDGRMPTGYYAMAEQTVKPFGPDLLTLKIETPESTNGTEYPTGSSGGLAVATAPPKPKVVNVASDDYTVKRRSISIRHSSDDRIVAWIELVSPGNKSSQPHFDAFRSKCVTAIANGYHLMIVDLFPPTPRDPDGIHAAIWAELSDEMPFCLPDDRPLSLVSYQNGSTRKAYLEATAVGFELIEMPLFFDADTYINVPLQPTYDEAWKAVAPKWKAILTS